jgi:hypothetical protein
MAGRRAGGGAVGLAGGGSGAVGVGWGCGGRGGRGRLGSGPVGLSVCLLLRLGRLVDLRPVLVCWSVGAPGAPVDLRPVLGAWGADARKPGALGSGRAVGVAGVEPRREG